MQTLRDTMQYFQMLQVFKDMWQVGQHDTRNKIWIKEYRAADEKASDGSQLNVFEFFHPGSNVLSLNEMVAIIARELTQHYVRYYCSVRGAEEYSDEFFEQTLFYLFKTGKFVSVFTPPARWLSK